MRSCDSAQDDVFIVVLLETVSFFRKRKTAKHAPSPHIIPFKKYFKKTLDTLQQIDDNNFATQQ